MKPFRPMSAVEQLAGHLRGEIRSGGLEGEMPGVARLVRELGVGTKTVVAALEILKREGLLEGRGERRQNQINAAGQVKRNGLQIRILLYEESDAHSELVVQLAFRLRERGHHVALAPKSLTSLQFDVERLARMVEKDDGDAWVVIAGSQPVLEWFAARPVPAFAMFGRVAHREFAMAGLGPIKRPALEDGLRRLVDLGHRRIVMLAPEEGRKPNPGLFERRFLEVLESLGVRTGNYNLPDWENDARGFRRCLESLFRHTPPTALFLNLPGLFFATLQNLSALGLAVPRDVSLVVLDDHPDFQWFDPEVSRIRTDTRQWIPRVVEWVGNVAKGKEDRRQTHTRAEFVAGGTIGPVPR